MNIIHTETHYSPTGKYKLELITHEVAPNIIHTHAQVSRCSRIANEVILTIDREDESFPFLFIENHVGDTRDYFVCNSSLTKQIVFELRMKLLFKQKDNFVWCNYHLDEKTNTLFVLGYEENNQYEVRFYDFTSPINYKWKLIKTSTNHVEKNFNLKTIEIERNGLFISCIATK